MAELNQLEAVGEKLAPAGASLVLWTLECPLEYMPSLKSHLSSSEEASFIPARNWQSLPGPRRLREEAGTGCLCRRLHMKERVGRRVHSRLCSPYPCPGQTAPLPPGVSFEVLSLQPGLVATESGRLLMLGGGGEASCNPTQP